MQVKQCGLVSVSDRGGPRSTVRSGTQRARHRSSEDDCCTLQRMACVQSGQALPGPWLLTGGDAEAPAVKGGRRPSGGNAKRP